MLIEWGLCLQQDRWANSCTSGTVAFEALSFSSTNGTQRQPIQDIALGCSIDSKNLKYPIIDRTQPTPVGGALGLGWGSRSFLAQTNPLSNGRFSYCFKANKTTRTYLRFGNDIVPPPNPQTTNIIQLKGSAAYYVNLQGISVNGVKLDITEVDFAVKSDGTGGVVLDSGTLFTVFVTPVYKNVLTALEEVFSNNKNMQKFTAHNYNFTNLCYEELSPEGRKSIPNFTFHLLGAYVEVKPQDLFVYAEFKGKNLFCLAMLTNDFRSAIGAQQQLNQKFVHDTKAKLVSFGPEDCEKNS